MKVSIIVPIYNAEKTLRRTLDSILAQTFTDFEVLMIDDGSKDSSGIICDEYSKKDARFHVIHKENGGVGAARQTGLDAAQGEFVIHADADDWVESMMLEEMIGAIGNMDVLIADYYSSTDVETKCIQQPTNCNDNLQMIRDFFSNLHGNCWNKLIRKKIIDKYNLRFFSGINYCEDLLFWIQAFSHPEVKVKYLNKPFYHYLCTQGHGSITANYTKNFIAMGQLLVEKMEQYLPECIKDEILISFKMSQKCGAFEHPVFTSKEYYAIYPEVNKYIMKSQSSFINRLLIYLSFKGFYHTATWMYRFKNRLTGHYVR